jgi:hypothetical protein
MAKVFAFALVCSVLGCSDYAYRHEIAGHVVTVGDAPVAGAVVQRVNDKGDPYGHDDAYRRVTDAQGNFSFVAEGRGPSPMAYAPWTLKVTKDNVGERTLEVRAAWSEDRATCFGYCAKGFTIELK